jgi:hypothetical protein
MGICVHYTSIHGHGHCIEFLFIVYKHSDMFDPLLMHLKPPREIGIFDKFRKWNTTATWFNFILPLLGLLAVLWFLKIKYDQKQALYHEYVPGYVS